MSRPWHQSYRVSLLYCDNREATYLSLNPAFHSRMKHMKIDFHFFCNKVLNKSLQVAFISRKDQLVDALTEPLSVARFALMCSSLHLQHLPLYLQEDVENHSTRSRHDQSNPQHQLTADTFYCCYVTKHCMHCMQVFTPLHPLHVMYHCHVTCSINH